MGKYPGLFCVTVLLITSSLAGVVPSFAFQKLGGFSDESKLQAAVNLTHLRGSLAADFGRGGAVNFTLDFPTSERLACLLTPPATTPPPNYPASGPSSIMATFDHGAVDPAPTPEPAPLSLFGMGLLGMAFVLRRRLKATAR